MLRVLIVIFVSVLLGVNSLQAQSIAQLKKSMAKAQRDIDNGNTLLKKNKHQTSNTVDKIIITNRNIANREKIVSSINKQISITKTSILNLNEDVDSLSAKLHNETKLYSEIIKSSYKQHLKSNNLAFLFSSSSLHELHLKMYYLKKYAEKKKELAESLKANSSNIIKSIDKLATKKSELEVSNKKAEIEVEKLGQEKKEYNDMHSKLTNENKKLKKQIIAGIKLKNSLERKISKIIEDDNKARAKRKLSKNDTQLSSDFAKNQGKLPHPAANGVITEQFGTHKHPLYPSIVVENKGINIAVPNGSAVKSIFNGVVTRVFFLQGLNNSIMIRHGDYISVYSGLTLVNVKTGDKVKTGTTLGKIIDPTQSASIHFELHKGRIALDPEKWLM